MDLFFQNGVRPATYTYEDYLADFTLYAAAITDAFPAAVKIQGATWASAARWTLENWTDYTSKTGKRFLGSLSYHRYPESVCRYV